MLFAKHAAIFARHTTICRTCRVFTGKRHRNPRIALYKTAHCGTAIKVRHFWWEKSGAHAAVFSSAAATRLSHFFNIHVPYTSKRMICKMCAPLFNKNMCRTFMVCLWVCAGSAGYKIAALFAKRAAIFANASHFHGKKLRNPWIVELYKTTLR